MVVPMLVEMGSDGQCVTSVMTAVPLCSVRKSVLLAVKCDSRKVFFLTSWTFTLFGVENDARVSRMMSRMTRFTPCTSNSQ